MVDKDCSTEKQLDEVLHTLDENNEFIKTIICYPLRDYTTKECSERIILITSLLRRIGVDGVYEVGRKKISGFRVLGKGWSSVVVLVKLGKRKAVAKIRRLDSRRKTLEHEAIILEYLKPYDIAPEPYFWSRDILIMEYIDGTGFTEYLQQVIDTGNFLVFVKKLFTRAWLLDTLRIDHTELNRPSSHVIVKNSTNMPYFIDFESAKYRSKPHNATSLASYLFFRSPLPVRQYVDKDFVVKKLRQYKETLSLEYLLELVDYLRVLFHRLP
ncbi:hypothetical protein J4526_04440 [Desulfurococcaceae archaeon MEX13E-LK6-19]|nr:hypothetical protein J4526_04440 [Desulfurococcaceae archaeon MEX13E-LK6-19]